MVSIEEYCKGFYIRHACIKTKGQVAFVLQEIQEDYEAYEEPEYMKTRIMAYLPDLTDADDGYGAYTFTGIRSAYVHMEDRLVVANSNGKIWESRTDGDWFSLLGDGRGSALFGIKKIGQYVFACGNMRKIYRRDGFKQWVDLCDEKQHAYLYADIDAREEKGIRHSYHPMGFQCFDGFNEQDIYTGSWYGGLWRYDGQQWYWVDLQTNGDIADIVCAPNGKVYVVMSSGEIFIGREDTWKVLNNTLEQPYTFANDAKSVAWFQGKLYIGTPFDLYVLDEEKLNKYAFPEDGHQQFSFEHVAACDEALLSYGTDQALIFDGEHWTEVFNNTPLLIQG